MLDILTGVPSQPSTKTVYAVSGDRATSRFGQTQACTYSQNADGNY